MIRARRLAALYACVVLSAAAVAGHAAELTVIDSLYAVAERAYASGDYDGAALHYDEVRARIGGLDEEDSAYLQNLSRVAGFLAGLSLEQAGDWEKALEE